MWNEERLREEVFKKHTGKFQIVPGVRVPWKNEEYTYKGVIPQEALLRTVLPDEIIIEFDGEEDENERLVGEVTRRLHGSYSFAVFEHGGRSHHIHIYNVIGLDVLGAEKRRTYKKLFLNKYAPYDSVDTTLTGEHLVALEFRPHFKHGVLKDCIAYYNHVENRLEVELVKKLSYTKTFEKPLVEDVRGMWLLKFLTSGKLKRGAIDLLLYKNAAILVKNRGLKKDYWFNLIAKTQDPDTPEHAVKMLESWYAWAESRPVRVFGFEVEKYCSRFGYDYEKMVREEYERNEELVLP